MNTKQKKSKPRQRILETALRLFYTQGYFATGINQIIKEAEVSKASFYDHFKSKEELCVAYLQERHLIWSGWLRDKIDEFDTPKERFFAPLAFLESWLPECEFRGCAFLNVTSEIPDISSAIRQQVIETKSNLKAVIKNLTQELKDSGEYQGLDVELVANSYYIIIEGAMMAAQIYGDILPVQQARSSIEALIRPL